MVARLHVFDAIQWQLQARSLAGNAELLHKILLCSHVGGVAVLVES